MKKKTVAGLIAIVIIASVVIFSGCLDEEMPTPSPTVTPTWRPQEGEHFSFRGNETKLVLVDSNFSYGVLPPDINRGGCPVTYPPLSHRDFKPGDACIIINGTVRNEYDEDYYICLSGQIYDTKEEHVGYMVKCPFITIFVESGEISFFELYIKHDKQDIVRYDISVNCISEMPPP